MDRSPLTQYRIRGIVSLLNVKVIFFSCHGNGCCIPTLLLWQLYTTFNLTSSCTLNSCSWKQIKETSCILFLARFVSWTQKACLIICGNAEHVLSYDAYLVFLRLLSHEIMVFSSLLINKMQASFSVVKAITSFIRYCIILFWIFFFCRHVCHLELTFINILDLSLLLYFLNWFGIIHEFLLSRAARSFSATLGILIFDLSIFIHLLHVDNCRFDHPLTLSCLLAFLLNWIHITISFFHFKVNLFLFCLFAVIIEIRLTIWIELTFDSIWRCHHIPWCMRFLTCFDRFSLMIFSSLLSYACIFKKC